MSEIPFRDPGRRTPTKGVHISLGGANWVFLTVCTEKRGRWLAQPSVQRALNFTIERWMGFWKDRLTKEIKSQRGAATPPYRDLAGQSCCFDSGGGATPPYQGREIKDGAMRLVRPTTMR